ncbi:MAG: cupin domain-containing protein [Fidelibacterota bacterium]
MMEILKKKNAPRYIRKEGIKSYLLASPITCNSNNLTTTLVEIEPGGKQRVHKHEPEQVYFIIDGMGEMTVGNEHQIVSCEDCIFIPSDEPHGLENIGESTLKYFSTASPSFTEKELNNFWPIESESTKK